jgi:hypothetical protein
LEATIDDLADRKCVPKTIAVRLAEKDAARALQPSFNEPGASALLSTRG